MKVITLTQPWATLVALGEKKYETRSWKTKHRGKLAIHASKKVDKQACLENTNVKMVLEKYGYNESNLPTGAILATSELIECHKVINDEESSAELENHINIKGTEYIFGNYTPGRYAWELQDIKLLKDPIPAKGQLRVWEHPL